MVKIINSKTDLCVGCNRCVRRCPMEAANITFLDSSDNLKVEVDHEKCIVCGRCVEACKHKARVYTDDTERFFDDLSKGVSISLMAAPSIITNFPEYKRLFTYLKQLGVNKIYDVSLGADICIWAYVKYMEKNNFAPLITQPCPSIVKYCEIYRHDLLDKLSPVQSPMACASIYMKRYRGINDSVAALSPCIAKSVEFHDTGLAQYNVTFNKLFQYLEDNRIELPSEETEFDHEKSGLGSLFPIPGGLKENIEYFTGKRLHITKSEGFNVYEKLDKYAKAKKEFIPEVFDVLNCIEGCTIGTACNHDQNVFEVNKKMDNRRIAAIADCSGGLYKQAYQTYDSTLDLSHFLREYQPVSITVPQITDNDIEKAFELLGKSSYEKQIIDCCACGSETCHEMARKIALNLNVPINCVVKSMEDAKAEHQKYVLINEQLLETANAAREASQTKTAFLANMSHEIRTPMNAIIGMLEILGHESLNDRQMSYIKDVRVSAHSLLGIINDILDMSKIEAGKLELTPVDFCFRTLMDNITSMFTYIANSKNIEFRFELADNLPDYLYGDDIRLKQVFVNLCGNAVKFTDKGYVRLSIKSVNEKLVIKIEDTGMGIRKDDLPKLFNAYEQSDKFKNRNVTGTGLGLSISKSFVELMGGEITVESEYGHGTAFTIVIPFVKGNDENIFNCKNKKSDETISAPDAKILITDDNEFNLKVASGLLDLIDIKAQTADSGFKAIELVKQNDYDVVFMDHMMPDMDGIETVQEIRKLGGKYEKLVIVALTANAVKGAREMFAENGFNDFISKPIDTDELHRVVKTHLPPEKVKTIIKAKPPQAKMDAEEKLRGRAIVTFVKENLETFKNITDSLNSGDIKTAHRIAHTLKSSAGYLGKKELQAVAASLEASFKDGAANHKPEELAVLEKELSAALSEFDPVVKKYEISKPKAGKIEIDKIDQIFPKLEPLLISGSFDALVFADELRGMEGMEELVEKIEDYDFDEAL
ncbi:MAG: ATP-binding protein, partial [Chitinispirillia bacterium]|nr:ATP-binding protein [Chitinispirillia bacterium]